MNILFISECYPSEQKPQYCVFLKQQYDALRQLGNTVDVLVPVRENRNGELEFIKDSVEDRYALPYCTDRYELFTSRAGRKIAERLKKLVESQNYELIAVHITGDAVLAAAVFLGEQYNIPVVQHYHGLNVWHNYATIHPHREEWHAKYREKLLSKCAAIIGVSNKVSDIIRERIKTTSVYTVYNGVNLELFYPLEHKSLTDGKIKIITVANLIQIKGLEYLIEAFKNIYHKYPQASLKIIGEGVLLNQLRNQADQLGIGDAVEFCGRQKYEDVARMMRESDMFVLPSFYEAIGCVYLEAMGCGIPTVGIRSMGIGEIIRNNENGMLAKEKNVESLSEKMMFLADNPEEAKRIGCAGRETAKKYTWKASAEALDKVYTSCV